MTSRLPRRSPARGTEKVITSGLQPARHFVFMGVFTKAAQLVQEMLGEENAEFRRAMERATSALLADQKAVAYYGQKGSPDYRAGRIEHPYDINCGFCEEWADSVVQQVPEAEVVGVANLTGNPDDDLEYPHVFVLYRGRFYDAECPGGVDDWKQLPAFQERKRKDVVG